MTNNIDDERMKSLKASFCRQHFPDLLQFLRDFDISQTEGKVANNTLNMNFLLQAFDHSDKITHGQRKSEKDEEYVERVQKAKQEARQLKSNCKWHFNDIKESDVLLAVEEYFKICSSRLDVETATHILLMNINTIVKAKKLFPIEPKEENEFYKFEDNATKIILNYFGINTDATTLGKQKDTFAQFVLDTNPPKNTNVKASEKVLPQSLLDSIPEAQFIQAFQLLAEVRNWSEHNHTYLQKSDYAFRLYRYIIFTQIGITYICRRLWNKNDAANNLINKNKYKRPDDFIEEKTKIKIIIKGNNKGDEISKCTWSVGNGKDVPVIEDKTEEIQFTISLNRYQPFKIGFYFNGEKQEDLWGLLNYYTWHPTLNIIVKPPHEACYTLEDIAGEDEETEEYIGNIFTKCIKSYFDKKASKSDKDKCDEALKKLGEIEPNIKELQELLGKVDEDAEQRKKDIHDTIIPQLKGIDVSLGEIKTGISRIFNFESNQWRALWSFITITGITFIIYCICNNIYSLLQYPIVFSIIVSVLILLFSLAFAYIVKSKNPINSFFVNKTKKKLFNIFKTIAFFLVMWGLLYFITISCRDNYLNNYDFAKNNTDTNQKVVILMESILRTNPKDDEDIRIQLSNYYLDYAGDAEKALLIASPMLDDTIKYKKGILAVAEALYCHGKDFWKVQDLLEDYKKNKRDSDVVNRINGIMAIWGQGRTSNISEGNRLLKLSADNGDPDAQYYLGYSYSHEMTDWEKSKETGQLEVSEYNLPDAVKYLRKAATTKPKAALELGILYADLNVKDSAAHYIKYALNHSNGKLYKESLYRLGLLYEGADSGLYYMKKAAFLNYEPAILYKASKVKDHKTAIELYSRPGGYQGYRYILPVTFDYLALGQKNKALKVLQEGRPFGKFDINFINAMEAMIDAQHESQFSKDAQDDSLKHKWASIAQCDSLEAMKLMYISSKQGCLYAEMICNFKEAVKNGCSNSLKNRLSEIGEEISFAYVLLAYIAHKEERFMPNGIPFADTFANKAIKMGNLAGRIMYVVPPYYEKFIKDSIRKEKWAALHFNIRQRALRVNKNKRWDILYSYKAETAYEGGKDSLSSSSRNFWNVVSKANNVDLNEVYHQPYVLSEITDIELLNEFSDRIIDKKQDNPFFNN